MMRCVQCSTDLIAPVRSEYWADRHACHVWLCPKCSTCFESSVHFPAEIASTNAIMIKDSIFPTFGVA